jgi:hypothetical protein
MEEIRIVHDINNLEIISKIMNSVAKQCDCRVKYHAEDRSIRFYGDADLQQYVTEQTLSFFKAA